MLKETLSLPAYGGTWAGTRYSEHRGRGDHRQLLRGQEGSPSSPWGSQQGGPIATLDQETRGRSTSWGPSRTVVTDGEPLCWGRGGGTERGTVAKAPSWCSPRWKQACSLWRDGKTEQHPPGSLPGASLVAGSSLGASEVSGEACGCPRLLSWVDPGCGMAL